jgi:ubiquinone/menaquinone biosynthesis C-methylase UbiE
VTEFDRFDGTYNQKLDPLLNPIGASSEEFGQAKAIWLNSFSERYCGPRRQLSVLEVGCGNGNLTVHLQDQFAQLDGCDISDVLINEAKERVPAANFKLSQANEPLPYPDQSYHIVAIACVLHHMKDAEFPLLFSEVRRVLKPGGWLLIFEHNPLNPVTRYIVANCDLDRDVERLITPNALRAASVQAGFGQHRTNYISFFPGKLQRFSPLEAWLNWLPLGGQYVFTAQRPPEPLEATADFSLVVPLYNEGENVIPVASALVTSLREVCSSFELVLVDNGSRDETQRHILELSQSYPEVKLAVVPKNLGYGWGVITGLWSSSGRAVGFMGGDGQISAQDVARTYQRFSQGDVDLAKVKRVTRGDGWNRLLISLICNGMFRLFFGVKTGDINGTPKIFRRSLLSSLAPSYKDWFLDAEVYLKIASCGEVGEVAVDFLPRNAGSSNVRWKTLWEFVKNMIGTGLASWGRRLSRQSPYGLDRQQIERARQNY